MIQFQGGQGLFMVNYPLITPRPRPRRRTAPGAVRGGTTSSGPTWPRVDADTPSAPPLGGINLGVGSASSSTRTSRGRGAVASSPPSTRRSTSPPTATRPRPRRPSTTRGQGGVPHGGHLPHVPGRRQAVRPDPVLQPDLHRDPAALDPAQRGGRKTPRDHRIHRGSPEGRCAAASTMVDPRTRATGTGSRASRRSSRTGPAPSGKLGWAARRSGVRHHAPGHALPDRAGAVGLPCSPLRLTAPGDKVAWACSGRLRHGVLGHRVLAGPGVTRAHHRGHRGRGARARSRARPRVMHGAVATAGSCAPRSWSYGVVTVVCAFAWFCALTSPPAT
ncbi:hypothetical protein QJS66_17840 [Kocuria rhizophila]|nr:hypothetical protein QJS66_17840 [Kocuria rhizophila]